MGALTSNRKRTDECFSLCSPSPSFNSANNFPYCYSDHIDTHIAKKPRISLVHTPGKVIDSPQRAVSRLNRYPEPEKLRREVHAPVRVNKFGFLASGLKRRCSGVWGKGSMGNVLLKRYEQAKHNAIAVLRYAIPVKGGRDKEVIDVEAEPWREDEISKDWVEIVADGHEVRSVVSDDRRLPESDGLEVETRRLDGKALDKGAIQGSSGLSDLIKVEQAARVLGSVSLDREAYKELMSSVDRSFSTKLSSLGFEIKTTEAHWQSLRLQKPKEKEKLEELKKPEENVLHEPFVELTEEEEVEVKRAFSSSNRKKILVTHDNSNIEITGEILQCLRPGAWLNDEVINVYLELLKERERREPKKYLNCHFFNTFFYKKLIGGRNGYDYKAVRRWTTQKKLGYGLLECDKIFVPIHKEVHWCLAIINKKDKSFQYLDSLGGRDHQVLRVLARYFADEVKDKSGQEIDVSSWELDFVEDLPEQQNGFDCGVFMIKYADFYSRGLGLQFSQENMPYFRRRTAKEILKLRAD